MKMWVPDNRGIPRNIYDLQENITFGNLNMSNINLSGFRTPIGFRAHSLNLANTTGLAGDLDFSGVYDLNMAGADLSLVKKLSLVEDVNLEKIGLPKDFPRDKINYVPRRVVQKYNEKVQLQTLQAAQQATMRFK